MILGMSFRTDRYGYFAKRVAHLAHGGVVFVDVGNGISTHDNGRIGHAGSELLQSLPW